MLGTVLPEAADAFGSIGESVTEVAKLAAVVFFGAQLSWRLVGQIGWSGWVAIALALVAVRPVALLPALGFSQLSWRERAAAAWFGPKGFASITYGLEPAQVRTASGLQAMLGAREPERTDTPAPARGRD